MEELALKLVQMQRGQEQLAAFAGRLRKWLLEVGNESDERVPDFTESRAKALLRAADLLDDPTRHSFERLVEQENGVRVALYGLLAQSKLAQEEEVAAIGATAAASDGDASLRDIKWLSLAIAAFGLHSGYPLYQFDPSSPPDPYSPAGQVLKRAAYFVRQEVQRSATERDKLQRRLGYDAAAVHPDAPSLEELQARDTIAPLPPHFRPPIPVRYPEVSRDTIRLDDDDAAAGESAQPTRGEPLKISREDLADTGGAQPVRQPPLEITVEQLPQPPRQAPQPTTTVVTPEATVTPGNAFSDAVTRKFNRKREPMKATKLRVVVQEYPDGPGMYGLQVRVSCQGIKSHVAGATRRDGTFLCELPVPLHSGLTYDVDVTWPREMDNEIERKSITLHADRTEFKLPFYRRLKP